MLYIAIGILGATVMPHNLYLHSSIVQTRKYEDTHGGKAEAIKFATIDSTVALMFALFINGAILVVSAASFHTSGHAEVAEIQDAYKLLTPLHGAGASTAFALALLASGQNSTLTGTLAGQIVMEGFLNVRIRPWLRRLITRLIAIVPAVIVAIIGGESGTAKLLILSQVILSLQLSFAVFPLVMFTSSKLKMGEFVNPVWLKVLAYFVAARLDVPAVVAHLGALAQRQPLLIARRPAVGDVDEHHRRSMEARELGDVHQDGVVVVGMLERDEDALIHGAGCRVSGTTRRASRAPSGRAARRSGSR
jgi:Mn2+/Fe2+ NRAMP family transporter